jgi:hypothetical protein
MKQELETLIVPSILLLAMIVISYKMYREYKAIKRAKAIQSKREEEPRFIIEKRVMRDLNYCEEYRNRNGSFNREKYVEYLEAR